MPGDLRADESLLQALQALQALEAAAAAVFARVALRVAPLRASLGPLPLVPCASDAVPSRPGR